MRFYTVKHQYQSNTNREQVYRSHIHMTPLGVAKSDIRVEMWNFSEQFQLELRKKNWALLKIWQKWRKYHQPWSLLPVDNDLQSSKLASYFQPDCIHSLLPSHQNLVFLIETWQEVPMQAFPLSLKTKSIASLFQASRKKNVVWLKQKKPSALC